MNEQAVLVARDADQLAELTAARLLVRLVECQAEGGSASLVLTGGGVGIAALAAMARSPLLGAVDWSAVDVWWGDERWVPADSADRNERQARDALLDHVPLDPARVHPMGSPDGPDGDDVDAAAERYVRELSGAPAFDVLLLGMGAEGHTASIFPESPAAHDERVAFAVRDCPKPPPTRISLGFAALTTAREVWLIVAGEGKAAMVATALSGAGRLQVPAAGARGTQSTSWLLDRAAASRR